MELNRTDKIFALFLVGSFPLTFPAFFATALPTGGSSQPTSSDLCDSSAEHCHKKYPFMARDTHGESDTSTYCLQAHIC